MVQLKWKDFYNSLLYQVASGLLKNTGFFSAGIGYAAMVMVAFQCIYYAVMIGWPLHYLLVTVLTKDSYPWSSCDNVWNTARCHDPSGVTIAMGGIGVNLTALGIPQDGIQYAFTSPAAEYFT
jgi:SNF family Na+-dependent transporter